MVKVETRIEKRATGATISKPTRSEIKGKLIEYLWHLKKSGLANSTAEMFTYYLKRLSREANLLDPESVKHVIALHENWSNGYKRNYVVAYNRFIEMQGLLWDPPNYVPVAKLPFIPLEEEIDALIAGCSKKVATTLQLLKETGMRIGEAWKLKWTDIDEKRQTIRCTSEKHGNPRLFKVSGKLISMLNTLPKRPELVLGGSLTSHRWSFTIQKRRLAKKLQNPRLNEITFHTFRHWKATMEYHRTKDILYVKQLLGHKSINNTLLYTQLVNFRSDEFHVKTAKTIKEACELAKVGFDYFTAMNDVQIFRKRK